MKTVTPFNTFSFAGARVYVYRANKGYGLPRHEHAYAHGFVVASGSAVVRVEGKESVRTPDSPALNLVANAWHEIEALEKGTVFINILEEAAAP